MTSCVIVANPKAGRGRALDVLRDALTGSELDARVVATQAPGHGIDVAAKARADGVPLVVAAGGDGTLHEVVNGLLQDGPGPDVPALGVVPLGSGCDYAKTFDIPADVPAALERLTTAAPRTIDAGEIVYQRDGRQHRRFFANIAEVGIGGSCVARAATLPRFLGPAMYGIAFLLTLPSFKRLRTTITMDDMTYEGPLTELVVAIGRVFGGGMRVTPDADPSDGLFDVQVQFGTKMDFVRGLPKVYKGTHVPHPRIREERARTVTVDSDPPGMIEADGEVLGHTPATFRTLPEALMLRA